LLQTLGRAPATIVVVALAVDIVPIVGNNQGGGRDERQNYDYACGAIF
jgi:hypothetical protein